MVLLRPVCGGRAVLRSSSKGLPVTAVRSFCYAGRLLGRRATLYTVKGRCFGSYAPLEFIADSSAVRFLERALQVIHESTGTPWWATIPLTVLMARSLITFPFAIIQRRITAKLVLLKPKMDELAKELFQEVKQAQRMFKWDEKKAKQVFNIEVRRPGVTVTGASCRHQHNGVQFLPAVTSYALVYCNNCHRWGYVLA